MTNSAHLTSEEIAAYLDETLSEADCARVKAHLADCAACREEVVAVSRLLQAGPRSRRRFVALSTIAAVAAVMVIFLVRPSTDSGLSSGGRLRAPQHRAMSEGVTVVRAIAPVGQQTSNDAIVFAWHPLAPGAAYRLTLTDDQGGKLWVAPTNDTTLHLPKGISLFPRRNYHWYVDVLEMDGSSATTGIVSFEVVR
jgi:anti-sigma factor RsiW